MKLKRILSLAVVLAMVLSIVPAFSLTASAATNSYNATAFGHSGNASGTGVFVGTGVTPNASGNENSAPCINGTTANKTDGNLGSSRIGYISFSVPKLAADEALKSATMKLNTTGVNGNLGGSWMKIAAYRTTGTPSSVKVGGMNASEYTAVNNDYSLSAAYWSKEQCSSSNLGLKTFDVTNALKDAMAETSGDTVTLSFRLQVPTAGLNISTAASDSAKQPVLEVETAKVASVTVNYVTSDNAPFSSITESAFVGDTFTVTTSDGKYVHVEKDGVTYLTELVSSTSATVEESGATVTATIKPLYKIATANLATNGSFEDGLTGWTSIEAKGALDSSKFLIVNDPVTDGRKALRTSDTNGDYSLENRWNVEANKKYYIAFDVMGTTDKNEQFSWISVGHDNAQTRALWDSRADGENGHFKTTQNVWETKVFIIDTAENETKIGFRGNWFKDNKPIYDNFRLYEVEKIPATVTIKHVDESGNSIGAEDSTVTGVYVGDSYTTSLPASLTVGDKTYILADTDKTITVDYVASNNVITVKYTEDTIASATNVTDITTRVNVTPALPQTVEVTLGSGAKMQAPVTWDSNDMQAANFTVENSPVTVNGTVNGTSVNVTATVTVKDKDDYLIAAYNFDNDLTDTSVNNHGEATKTGTVEFVDGVKGKAIKLPGTSNKSGYVKLPSTVTDAIMSATDNGGAMTVSMYVQKNTAQNQFIFSMHSDPSVQKAWERAFGLIDSAGSDALRFEGLDKYKGDRGLNEPEKKYTTVDRSKADEQFVLLTFTVDYDENNRGTMKMYVDGVDVTDETRGINLVDGKIDFTPSMLKTGANGNMDTYIGLSPYSGSADNDGDNNYSGIIDDFKIYSVALTASEVAAMAAETPGLVTMPVKYLNAEGKEIQAQTSVKGYVGNTTTVTPSASITDASTNTVYVLDEGQSTEVTFTDAADAVKVFTYHKDALKSVDSVTATVIEGNTPVLPTTIKGVTETGVNAEVQVTEWDYSTLTGTGEKTVKGKIDGFADGATATVTVLAKTFSVENISSTNGAVKNTTAFTAPVTGEFAFEFDYLSSQRGDDWIYISQNQGESGMWGGGNLAIGVGNNLIKAPNELGKSPENQVSTALNANETYRFLVKGNTKSNSYNIVITDANGNIVLDGSKTFYFRTNDTTNGIPLNYINIRGGFEMSNIKVYCPDAASSIKTFKVTVTGAGDNNTSYEVSATSAAGVEVPAFDGYILKTRTVSGKPGSYGNEITLEYEAVSESVGAWVTRNNFVNDPWISTSKYLGTHNSFTDKMQATSDYEDPAGIMYGDEGSKRAYDGGLAKSQTQTLDALEQLNAGVRYFDIRLSRLADGTFWTRHGLLSEDFEGIAYTIAQFAKENPGEVIILDFQSLYDAMYTSDKVVNDDTYYGNKAGDDNKEAYIALEALLKKAGIMNYVPGNWDQHYNKLTDSGNKACIIVLSKQRGANSVSSFVSRDNANHTGVLDGDMTYLAAETFTAASYDKVLDKINSNYANLPSGAKLGVIHAYTTPAPVGSGNIVDDAATNNPKFLENASKWLATNGDIMLINNIAAAEGYLEKIAEFNRDGFDGTYTNTVSGVKVEGPSTNVPFSTVLNVGAEDVTVEGYTSAKQYDVSLKQFSNTVSNVTDNVTLTFPKASADNTTVDVLLSAADNSVLKEAALGEAIVYETKSLGSYILATKAAPTVNMTVEYKIGETVVDTVTGSFAIGAEAYNVPESAECYVEFGGKAYIVSAAAQSHVVAADDADKTYTVQYTLVHDNAVLADTFANADGSNDCNNTSNLVFIGMTGDNAAASVDADNAKTSSRNATDAPLGNPRVGLISFKVPEVADGKAVVMNTYVAATNKNIGGGAWYKIAANPISNVLVNEGEGYKVADYKYDDSKAIWSLSSITCPNDDVDMRPTNQWVQFDVTEAVKAAKAANEEYITFAFYVPNGGAYIADREKAVAGGAYAGKAAYLDVVDANTVTFVNADKITKVTKNGSLVANMSAVTAAPGASIKVYTNEVADGAIFTDESGEVAATVTGNVATITPATSMTLTGPREFGIKLNKGAQVRIGQGVDTTTGKVLENAAVMKGSGLRFIATVERTDSMAETADEFGIRIYPQGNEDAAVNVKATSFQDTDRTVFTAALTNLKPTNYNVVFVANPYVIVGDKTYVDKSQTTERSIYQVAAGLLVGNESADVTENGTELAQALGENGIKVLNAYLNQVGVRLSISNIAADGTVSIRTESNKSGAYTGVPFFTITEDSKTGNSGVYTITLQAKGDNVTFSDFWNEYIRINNNNSKVVKGITVDNGKALDNTTCKAAISKDRKTLTFTFNYNTATATN